MRGSTPPVASYSTRTSVSAQRRERGGEKEEERVRGGGRNVKRDIEWVSCWKQQSEQLRPKCFVLELFSTPIHAPSVARGLRCEPREGT